jgi:iron-sulfur cluster repair protein YtfE (RIC family)
MTDLCKLRGEHSEIQKIVRKLRYLISHPSPPPQLHLFALRHELSATLIAHLKTEDWLLYPQLMASADAHIAATARAFSEEMGGLAAAYRSHCQSWNAEAITADWAGYCRDSRELIDALNNRITRENRDLYPLLERLDRAA